MAATVSIDNFVAAETARMFDGTLMTTGRVNRWAHYREPVAMDAQTVIRMNRDTLYSGAIVDISKGATVTLPDTGDRYMSVMVVNEDHYINRIFHDAGTYDLTVDEFDTSWVAVVARIFVDPNDPADLSIVHDLQDQLVVEAGSARPYMHEVYDEESRNLTHGLILELAKGVPDSTSTFGTKETVNPLRHLTGAASGWGGMPEYEAFYLLETEPRPVGNYTMTIKDVPFDGFWSVAIYNRDGFFEENEYDSYGTNNVTAVANEDGTVTLNLSPDGEGLINHLHVMDGWNYAFRVYRPREEVVNGTWTAPKPVPTS
jgi:hypothetical protein